jgi:hypothetical protein
MSCFQCLCCSCANDVNNIRRKPEEQCFPCFNCEECWDYAHDTKHRRYNHKTECSNYVITEWHANARKSKIRIIK